MEADIFATRDAPAADINTLLNHLKKEDTGAYLYRGQTRDYGGPLLASIFRNTLDVSERGGLEDLMKEDVRSMRSIGKIFVGNYVQDYPRSLVKLDAATKETEAHRDVIRQKFLNAFGFLLGFTFAQHYGFKSEMLDVSTDVEVAAFFATHASPHYDLVGPDGPDKTGVIYRFARLDTNIPASEFLQRTYYTAPGTLVCHELLKRFEADVTLQEAWESLRYYYELYRATGERKFDLLKLPRGMVASSRVGRQSAAVLIHDEIQLVSKSPSYGVGPIFGELQINVDQRQPVFQSFEDFNTREGTRAYYFRHGGARPEINLTAETLWPNKTDDLLLTIAYVLSGSFSHYVEPFGDMPDRFDLVDPGVGMLEPDRMKQQIGETLQGQDDFSGTIKYAKLLHDSSDCLTYFIRKAASLCYKSHVTADHEMARECIQLIDEALSIDSESVVLLVLKNMMHEALGEKGKAMLALGRAYKEAGGLKGMGIVQEILKELYDKRWDPGFPRLLWEYYQSF